MPPKAKAKAKPKAKAASKPQKRRAPDTTASLEDDLVAWAQSLELSEIPSYSRTELQQVLRTGIRNGLKTTAKPTGAGSDSDGIRAALESAKAMYDPPTAADDSQGGVGNLTPPVQKTVSAPPVYTALTKQKSTAKPKEGSELELAEVQLAKLREGNPR